MKNKGAVFVKILLLTLLGVMLLGIPISASAKTVATIGSKKYSSLKTAIAKVKRGQTIKLRTNVTLSDELDLNKNTTYTIDLNKKKIKAASDSSPYFNLNKGRLTLKNGTVEAKLYVEKGATLTIQSGTYQNLTNFGKTTIKNGKFTNKKKFLNTVINNYNKLTIEKATVRSYEGHCIENSFESTMTIKGGTYKDASKDGGQNVITNSGTLFIKGGTITSPTSNRANPINNMGTVTISGGKIIIPNSSPYYPGEPQYGHIVNADGKMTITGGTIIAKKNVTAIYSSGTLKITGGRFESYYPTRRTAEEYRQTFPAVIEVHGGTLSMTGGTIYSKNGRALGIAPGRTYKVEGVKISSPYTGLEN